MAAVSNGMPFIRHRGWFQLLLFCLWVATLLPGHLSAMETASFRVDHISLEEAKGLAQTQLSPAGQLSILSFRSLLIVVDEHKNIEKIRQALQQFDVPASGVMLSLQILAVSAAQSRSLVEGGQSLSGGWKLLHRHANKYLLMASKKVWLQSGTSIKIETGSVRPIRSEIRYWLEYHGVHDAPDLALHPIAAGFEIQVRLKNNSPATLTLNPWLRLSGPSQVTAAGDIEILPDLGSTNSPQQPPSTVATMRLNIRPIDNINTVRYIRINSADSEVNIRIGEEIELLAYEREARAFGDAILSETINAQKYLVVLKLLLE